MFERALRGLVTCVLVVLVPLTSFAADSNAAMLYTNGATWVNGVHVPRPTAAIFFGDLLQTRSDSIANINQPGSTITVLADSLVKFEGASVDIEHGGVTVSTSKGVTTTAGDVKVSPASTSWTEFNVTDVDGVVRIAARKGDLTISDGKDTVTLAQGQEATRDESSDNDQKTGKKKGRGRGTGAAVPGASGGILNSPFAVAVGFATGATVIVWAIARGDDPVSPAVP